MNKLPPYIYGQGEGLGAGIVIANQSPPIVGRIILFPSYIVLLERLNAKPPLAHATVQGYSIAIVYDSILGREHKLLVNAGTIEELQRAMQGMAEWYYKERIQPHKPRFKRYLL